jgi:hypothetical protein
MIGYTDSRGVKASLKLNRGRIMVQRFGPTTPKQFLRSMGLSGGNLVAIGLVCFRLLCGRGVDGPSRICIACP